MTRQWAGDGRSVGSCRNNRFGVEKLWETTEASFLSVFAACGSRIFSSVDLTPAFAPARSVRAFVATMGWLTRFLASKMEDPGKRQADFEQHMVETTAKCEEVYVRRKSYPYCVDRGA